MSFSFGGVRWSSVLTRFGVIGLVLGGLALSQSASSQWELDEYARRTQVVRNVPGFVALWDFVKREHGRFSAWQATGDTHDFSLEATNYIRDYWGTGRTATYDDFPLLGRGPFGQAIQFRQETDPDFRPTLLIPRARLHDSGLDVKGAGQSVSMVVWLIRESGNHAIAGIWHEGTDLAVQGAKPRLEAGQRQYALFAGLAANNGAVAAHISENGGASFGDKYARNLASTPQILRPVDAASPAKILDHAWQLAGFTFDNSNHTVTAYLDGEAQDLWVEDPGKHPFFQWPAKGWVQAQARSVPSMATLRDSTYPAGQLYQPPEEKPEAVQILQNSPEERIELQTFRFTKVRVTSRQGRVLLRELVALRANPFWFPHDLYQPKPGEGGPFTIGRVIHLGRSVGFTGWIGGVAVFKRALTKAEMERLARVAVTAIPETTR